MRKGIELGMNLIDTAEAYHTEDIVGDVVRSHSREELFIATKVWPSHLRYDDVLRSAEGSLTSLGTNYVDLYQIHWPNDKVPIRETMRAMEKLMEEGKVRYVGVSNFSLSQMIEANDCLSRHDIASNQVEYNLLAREAEGELLPYCEANGVALIAYRPVAHGRLASPSGRLVEAIQAIGTNHEGKTSSQVALNWLLRKGHNVFPIPRASRPSRVIEDAGATGWELTPEETSGLQAAAKA